MQRIKRIVLSPTGLVVAVLAAAVIVLGAYAYTVSQQTQVSTGVISVGSENANLQVTTYDGSGVAVPSSGWCAFPNATYSSSTTCSLKVHNAAAGTPLYAYMSTVSVENSDGKGLATHFNKDVLRLAPCLPIGVACVGNQLVSSSNSCDTAFNTSEGTTLSQSSLATVGPIFGGASPNHGSAILLQPQQDVWLCFRLNYNQNGPIFDASTSAVLAVDGDSD